MRHIIYNEIFNLHHPELFDGLFVGATGAELAYINSRKNRLKTKIISRLDIKKQGIVRQRETLADFLGDCDDFIDAAPSIREHRQEYGELWIEQISKFSEREHIQEYLGHHRERA